jgi:hypothetical protein
VVVVISDDQDELFFEDNMPTFSVYWGDSIPIIPRKPGPGSNPKAAFFSWGYGEELVLPTHRALGRHIIEHMITNDFDVSHFNYIKENYGGQVTRRYPREDAGEQVVRTTEPRPMGLPHGYSFVVRRIQENRTRATRRTSQRRAGALPSAKPYARP